VGRPLTDPVVGARSRAAAPGAEQVVILGAGRAVRGSLPSAMVDIHERGRVMDWLLAAFAALDAPEVYFVGGYKAEEVVERYPSLRPVFNREWASTGPVRSLGLAPVDVRRDVYVTYSDVVFRRRAVEALRASAGEVVLAVDSRWRERYDGRSRRDLDRAEKVRRSGRRVLDLGPHLGTDVADAEYAGLLRLGPRAAEAAFAAIESGALSDRSTVPELVRHLRAAGLDLEAVDLEGEWAELDAQQDLARFVLGTKAESLERLRGMQHGGEIGDLAVLTFSEWSRARGDVIARVLATVPGERLIVRSSALSEDTWTESGAGRHESVLDVDRADDALAAAIDAVFASYAVRNPDDQVLVQEMLRDVAMSGVVMTRTHALGAPYYVFNFDDRTARTDTVTAGGEVRTVVCFRGAGLRAEVPPALASVLATVQDIEKLVGHDSLDVEFAVTTDERVHVLQVRPIAVGHSRAPVDDEAVAAALAQARRLVCERQAPPPSLVGCSTRFSVMTDWNPAEIVGTKPRRLAISLYRHLVTDEVWARQRAEYGYRDVRPCPLLVEIAGQPYVDVRASFASFMPAALPDELAARLVDHAINRLAVEPSLHDKAEFEVLATCLAPDFDRIAALLRSDGFSTAEVECLRDALQAITVGGFARLDADLCSLAGLEAETHRIEATPVPHLERAFHQLELVRRRGALVFAHLARAAFVATSLLRGFVSEGVLAAERVDAYLRSIETVFGRLQSDAARVRGGDLAWDTFVERYGHLRPGTYDITSPSYRSVPDEYLAPLVDGAPSTAALPNAHVWGQAERSRIAASLSAMGLPDDVDILDAFLGRAIAGREEGKFVFTRSLSRALEHLTEFGADQGLGPDDLAHIAIADLLSCRDALPDPAGFLRRRALEGREAHEVSQAVCLPSQVGSIVDLTCFEQPAAEPNFVTQHAVQARTVAIDTEPHAEVAGRIVMIPSADPGYDWLLARGIVGLVTMYGGANSHMAVRASEAGLPAVIGAGERLYEELAAATVVRLDCGSRTVTVVS